MGKTYLRYVPSEIHGVITSPTCNIACDPAGNFLFTGELEKVGIWDIRKGIQVGSLKVAGTSPTSRADVTCIVCSSDGKSVAIGYLDGMIRIFNYKLMTLSSILNGHKKAVTSIAFNNSNTLLCSGSKDTDIILWDLVSERGLCRLRGHKDEITDVKFVSLGNRSIFIVSTSKDTLVKVWDCSLQVCSQTMVGARAELWSLDISPVGDRCVAGGSDNLLRFWRIVAPDSNAATSSSQETVLVPFGTLSRQTQDRVISVRMSASGDFLVVHSASKIAEVYRRRDQAETRKRALRRLKRHREKMAKKERASVEEPSRSAESEGGDGEEEEDEGSLSLAGTSLAEIDALLAKFESTSASAPSSVESLIASDEWELVGICNAAAKVTASLILPASNDSSLNAAASGSLKLVLGTQNNQIEVHSMPTNDVQSLALGASKYKAVSGLLAYQSSLLRSISMSGHRGDVRAVTISSDGAMFLTSSVGCAKLWNSKTGNVFRTLEFADSNNVGLAVAFAPGNKFALVGTKSGKLLLFDLSSGDLLEEAQAHSGAIWSLAIKPDGKSFATGSADKEVKFWDFDQKGAGVTMVHTRTLKLNEEVLAIKFSHHLEPEKLLLAVSLLDSTVKVFFDDTLKFFLSLYGHKLPVMALDISADNTLLVSASADKNVKLWGLDFGDCHRSFFAHQDSVMTVGFVANSHYFFTGSKDRSIKYWDGDRFENILTLEGHKGDVWGLAVSSDGSYLVSVSHDRSVRTWKRTEEQVFIDEERENEMEALIDKQARDPDGDDVLNKQDMIGSLGEDGFAVPENDLEKSVTTITLGSGIETTGVVAHATKETAKGADRLVDALSLAIIEHDKWIEYEQDVSAAVTNGDDPSVVDPPSRNLLLLGLTPSLYLLKTLRNIRPADLDQVLLSLSFADAVKLLKFLLHLLRKGYGVEVCTRAILLLLRVHEAQIIANKSSASMLVSLKQVLKSSVMDIKHNIGFNVAGLKFLTKQLQEEISQDNFGSDTVVPGEASGHKVVGKRQGGNQDSGIRVGKRQNVNIF
jgi:U3 small nucleolar RNA-associated protein 12